MRRFCALLPWLLVAGAPACKCSTGGDVTAREVSLTTYPTLSELESEAKRRLSTSRSWGLGDDLEHLRGRWATSTPNRLPDSDQVDYVRTEGTELFVALAGALRIVHTTPAGQAEVFSTVPLRPEPNALFVAGERAVVFTGPWLGSAQLCGPSMRCSFDELPPGTSLLDVRTTAHLLDIQDRRAPRELRKLGFTGTLVAAHKMGTTIRAVVMQSFARLSDCAPGLVQGWSCRTDNRDVLEHLHVERDLPHVFVDGRELPRDSRRIYLGELAGHDAGSLTLVSFDVLDPTTAPDVMTVVTDSSLVSLTADTLLVAVPGPETKRSSVHTFRLGTKPTDVTYSGTTVWQDVSAADGSEHRGFFRHGSSLFGRFGEQTTARALALPPDLVDVEANRAYSLRLLDGVAAQLTVADLTAPSAAPMLVAGPLPDVREPPLALRVIDEQHVLAVGRLLQIWDLRERERPRVAFTVAGIDPELLRPYPYRASTVGRPNLPIHYAPDSGLLAVPTSRGLAVYRVSVREGISKLGEVLHTASTGRAVMDADKLASVRSAFFGEFVYSIGADAIRAQRLDQMGHDTAMIPLP